MRRDFLRADTQEVVMSAYEFLYDHDRFRFKRGQLQEVGLNEESVEMLIGWLFGVSASVDGPGL